MAVRDEHGFIHYSREELEQVPPFEVRYGAPAARRGTGPAAGGAAGTLAGAAIGSAWGPAGTVAGGIAGAALGSTAGAINAQTGSRQPQ